MPTYTPPHRERHETRAGYFKRLADAALDRDGAGMAQPDLFGQLPCELAGAGFEHPKRSAESPSLNLREPA